MLNLLELVISNNLSEYLLDGNFGLELENLRVDLNGNISKTNHPSVFGDKSTHPFITTDFAESQIEIITPQLKSIDNELLKIKK